jgi:hypothetical protein
VKSDPSLAGKGFELIKTLLPNKDWRVRESASLTLAEIVKSNQSLAG